jgi:two-component system, cell cycle response regulator
VILDMVSRERMRQSRGGRAFGIVMVDVDHFKYVNDNYGHLIGDVVLQETSKRMAASVRPYDFVGRYGGEEFLIVVPTSDVAGLMGLAERIRKAIESKPIHTEAGEIAITASFGVAASTDADPHEAEELLRLADDALYRAKQRGRNRCELANEEDLAALHAGHSNVEAATEKSATR